MRTSPSQVRASPFLGAHPLPSVRGYFSFSSGTSGGVGAERQAEGAGAGFGRLFSAALHRERCGTGPAAAPGLSRAGKALREPPGDEGKREELNGGGVRRGKRKKKKHHHERKEAQAMRCAKVYSLLFPPPPQKKINLESGSRSCGSATRGLFSPFLPSLFFFFLLRKEAGTFPSPLPAGGRGAPPPAARLPRGASGGTPFPLFFP